MIEQLRKKIRVQMAEADIKGKDVASKLGVSRNTFYNAMRLRENPKSIELLNRAMKLLNKQAAA